MHNLRGQGLVTSFDNWSLISLHTDIFGRKDPPVPHAVDLLDAMIATPKFGASEPSDDVVAYLKCIENADPNSPEFRDSEDNYDQSWGHYQYNAGNMSINGTLKDWVCTGNTTTACKFLAAALQTCEMARYICRLRGVQTNSYLSDVYLERIVERLWEIWKMAGGVCTEYLTLLKHTHLISNVYRKLLRAKIFNLREYY